MPYHTLWSVPLDGSPPRALVQRALVQWALVQRALVQFEDPYTTFGRGTFKAVGSTLYFVQLTSESDVSMAEITER